MVVVGCLDRSDAIGELHVLDRAFNFIGAAGFPLISHRMRLGRLGLLSDWS